MPVAGWYQDPRGAGRFRFWDGTAWTEVTTLDPANTPWPAAPAGGLGVPGAPTSQVSTPITPATPTAPTAAPGFTPVEPQPASPWSATPAWQPQATPGQAPTYGQPAPAYGQQPAYGQTGPAYAQPPAAYPYPGTPAPKKGIPLVAIIVAGVVALAVIATAVWYFGFKPKPADPNTNPSVSGNPATATGTPPTGAQPTGVAPVPISAPGSIVGWGEADFHQITPDAYLNNETVGPTVIPETNGAVVIAAGSVANYFIKADGTLWGWGVLASQRASAENPVRIGDWTNVVDVAAFKDSESILVLLADGTVYALGDNEYGEIGTGTPSDSRVLTPFKVSGISDAVAIAAGGATGYALDSSGALWAWGSNESGQLGVGHANENFAVVSVPGLPKIAAIGAGRSCAFAIEASGQLWAWGANSSGQLGLGNSNDAYKPTKTGITDAVFVDGGDDTTYVIRSDKSLWATGHGTYGEFGNGERRSSNVFVASSITDCVDVSQLWGSTVAVVGNGDVYVFGNNWDGRLGIGSAEEDIAVPTKNGVTGATRVAAGWWHAIALTPS